MVSHAVIHARSLMSPSLLKLTPLTKQIQVNIALPIIVQKGHKKEESTA
ncbi:Uncharacterised protein [Wolbachia endosymbiont wPip_Mol of Culex molestus]|nr:Uncharacterised protein [Wolbachia endosymbiont wPip_Mol of Culex molestus]